uniref:Putative alpha-L-fucosidase n=1 Tax=Panagrellus redivivus TaxID=6233 RepID=A0A7E4ZTA6_PANRE
MMDKMFCLLILVSLIVALTAKKYEPNWSSIDSRPLPLWYDDVKFGIFTHWGLYSVPAFSNEWLWYDWRGRKNPEIVAYLDKHFHGQSYADFATQFTAEDLDPAQFADIVAASGAKYFVLTSKHHEGFTLWPSNTTFNWNVVDVGPKQDLLATFKDAFKKTDIHFGLYLSLMDWFHPLFLSDNANNKTEFVDKVSYLQRLEIVEKYEPEVFWSDGDWNLSPEYWKAKEFLAWLYNESPVKDKIVVNDRWGNGTMGKHGGYLTFHDHYDPGQILERKWENCLTLDRKSWGYRRGMTADDVRTVKEVLDQLVRTISCNGNLLLNIGPDRFGRIPPIFEERLRSIGKIIKANSVAIYGTKPWIHQNDTNIWYTSSVRNATGLDPRRIFNPQDQENTIVYAWIFDIPDNGTVNLPSVKPTDKTNITVLGTTISVAHSPVSTGISVDLHALPFQKLPSTDVIILKIEYAATSHRNPLKRAHHHHHQNRTQKKLFKDYLQSNQFNHD